jgi:tetratricopeptide (TPR) repeat protein
LESKALALDPDYTWARDQKGWVLLTQGRNDEAVSEYERALALDPSNADADSGLGYAYLHVGEFDKSFESFDKAIRLSPYDHALVYWYAGKASADFALKRYDQAIEMARQAIAINPNYVQFAHTILVAALALTGHDAEAREALQHYLALPSTGPLKTIAAWKALNKSQRGVPRYVENSERMYDGLRKAGMPEE